MKSRFKNSRTWVMAEPWTVAVGTRVRVLTTTLRGLHVVGRVIEVFKQGWGVRVRLPDGATVTRDVHDVAVRRGKSS